MRLEEVDLAIGAAIEPSGALRFEVLYGREGSGLVSAVMTDQDQGRGAEGNDLCERIRVGPRMGRAGGAEAVSEPRELEVSGKATRRAPPAAASSASADGGPRCWPRQSAGVELREGDGQVMPAPSYVGAIARRDGR